MVNKTDDAMKLGTYGNVEVHRVDKMLVVQFLKPHQVMSTCRVNGGLHDGLECVFNHQSCEPAAHSRKELKTIISNPEDYLSGLCSRYAGQLEHEAAGTGNDEFLEFLFACCALGYSEKWKD
ncbi:MAG: hypothetical protein UMU76_06245 [Prosthecochloris sp.]|nr:hypothetical protein [Prosthecochloris sp.]